MTTTLPTGAVGHEAEPPRTMLRAVARGGLANLTGTAFTAVAGLGVTWLVARGLGQEHAGAFFTATAAFALGVAVSRVGTQTSLVYWPARLRATGGSGALHRCLRVGLTPVAGASIAVGVALWLGAGLVGSPEVATQLRILALFTPAAALADAMLAATRGFRAMRPTVLLDKVMRPGVQVVLLAGLAAAAHWGGADPPPAAFAAAWAAPLVPLAVFGGYALAKLARATTAPPGDTEAPFTAREYWSFSAPRAVASVAQTALQRVDVLLVAALAGLGPAALYTVAGRFVVLGQFVNQGLSQAVQPRLAERLAIGDRVGVNTLYRQATAWLVLTTWPIYLIVMAYASVYLGLFGPAYATGVPVVFVLASAMLVATGCGMVDMVLAMGGRTWWNLGNVGLALAVMVPIDLVLVPRLGALGAAIGLAAAILTNNLVPLAQIWTVLGVHPFGRATIVAGALAIGCFGVPPLLLNAAADGEAPAALKLGATACGVVAYLSGALRLRKTLTQGTS